MARKVEVTLIDDIDGTPASRTVEFSIDGTAYEIDLSDANIKRLNDAVADFVDNARKLRGARRRGRAATPAATGVKPQDVRKWAEEHGMEVSARGRIPRDVLEAYHAAN